MLDWIAPFFVGFIGSVHCLGMCGPLVMAYSLQLRKTIITDSTAVSSLWRLGIAQHLAFHSGRILTYGLLGALAAGLTHLAAINPLLAGVRGGVSLAAGIGMIFFGLVILKVVPFRTPFLPSWGPESFLGRRLPPLLSASGLASKGLLGVAAGFLPCMLSWAMILKAAATEDFGQGFLTMALFGLGTLPALFFIGLASSLLSWKVRLHGERVAAVSVILMGGILIFRGAKYFA